MYVILKHILKVWAYDKKIIWFRKISIRYF